MGEKGKSHSSQRNIYHHSVYRHSVFVVAASLFCFVFCFNTFLIPSDPWSQPLERSCIVYRRKVSEYHCHAVTFSEWDQHVALVWHSCRRPRLLSVLVLLSLCALACTVPVTASEAITTCEHPSVSALLCVLPCGDIFQTSSFFVFLFALIQPYWLTGRKTPTYLFFVCLLIYFYFL